MQKLVWKNERSAAGSFNDSGRRGELRVVRKGRRAQHPCSDPAFEVL